MINIYSFQIILILFFGFLFRENKKRFLVAAFITLFVVMAFRNARIVGNDSTTSYYGEFEGIAKAEITWPNPGLPILMKAIHLFSNNYQWVIIITAIWVCFAYYKLLVKYSENGFISVMWFMGMLFYPFLFSALKQAWAMAFLCFAFDAIFEKKPFRYILFVGLAVIFHFPALIFLPAYWIAKLKINRAFPILMFGVLVSVFIFRSRILNLMTSAYSKGEEVFSSDGRFIGTKVVFMILILAYGFYQFFTQKSDSSHDKHRFSTLIYFMGLAAVIQTFCFYNNIFERLADYYFQFSILFIPLILSRNNYASSLSESIQSPQNNSLSGSGATLEKKKLRNYTIDDIDLNSVLALLVTVFCVWRFISYIISGSASLLPFYFFWQG